MTPHITRAPLYIVWLCLIATVAACVPLAFIGITVTAVEVDQERRTFGRYVDDNLIELELREAMRTEEAFADANISVTVFNGIVLLTGQVHGDAERRHAGEIALDYIARRDIGKDYQEARTRLSSHIVNQLELAGPTNLSSRLTDSWITTKAKAQLLQADNLANSVKVVTEHGTVYLLGLVTPAEADAAVDAVRSIKGVTRIVKVFDYIR